MINTIIIELQELISKINTKAYSLKHLATNSAKGKIVFAYYQKILPILYDLLINNQYNTQDLINHLQAFFVQNWNFINVTFDGNLLCYTALPDEAPTAIMCKLAHFIETESNKDLKDNAKPLDIIKILMPTVSVESLVPHKYPHLGTWKNAENKWQHINIDIQKVLQTHILGYKGLYLIPVKLFKEQSITSLKYKLYNPYYDIDAHQKEGNLEYLNKEELKRLREHSHRTQEIYTAKLNYLSLLNDNTNLLGKIYELMKHLYYNSVQGVGTEDYAAEGFHTAIVNFSNYYEKLTKEQQQTIPYTVRKELELLFAYVSDYQRNKNDSTSTCIATRRASLENSIKTQDHEAILSNIRIDGINKENLLEKSRIDLESTLKSLTEDTVGFDKLNIKIHLLKKLNLVFQIQDFEDLEIFKDLSCEEIQEFLADPTLKNQCVVIIDNIYNLAIFLMSLSHKRLATLLKYLSFEICKKFINEPRDLSILLLNFNLTAVKIISQEFHIHLAEFLCPQNIEDLLEPLDEEKREIIFNFFKEDFLNIIKSGADLCKVFKFLSNSQRTILFNELKTKLYLLLETGFDFNGMLIYLNEEQREEAFETTKELLPNIIEMVEEFYEIFNLLTVSQFYKAYNILEDKLNTLIITGKNFNEVMHNLTQEQRDIFFNLFKKQISTLVKSGRDFKFILEPLSVEQKNLLFDELKDKLSEVVYSINDLEHALYHLNSNQREFIYDLFIKLNRFNDLVKHGEDFGNLIKNLNDIQVAAMFELFQEKLPSLLQRSLDCYKILQKLNIKQRTIAFEILVTQLPAIIKTENDLYNILNYLTETQCFIVCKELKEQFIHFQAYNLQWTLKLLHSSQRSAIFKALNEKFIVIIHSGKDFSLLARYFNLTECEILCKNFKEVFNKIVNSSAEFADMLTHLEPINQTSIICNLFKEEINFLVNSKEDCLKLFTKLTNQKQRKTLLENLNPILIKITSSKEDLHDFYNRLLLGTKYNPEKILHTNSFFIPETENPAISTQATEDTTNIFEWI